MSGVWLCPIEMVTSWMGLFHIKPWCERDECVAKGKVLPESVTEPSIHPFTVLTVKVQTVKTVSVA